VSPLKGNACFLPKGTPLMNKEIRQILRTRRESLEASGKDLKTIFETTFQVRDYIMCETNDGFRIKKYTYGQIYDQVCQAAGALHARIGASHRYIALEMDNGPDWIVAFWAILMSGNKPYLVNLRYPASLTEGILKTLQVEYILCAESTQLSGTAIPMSSLTGEHTAPPAEVFENELSAPTDEASLVHKLKILDLPIRRVTPSEVKNAERAIKEYIDATDGDVDYNDAAKLQVHLGVLKRAEMQEIQNTLPTEIHVIRLGELVFATNPFELFLNYGNKLKARSPAEQTFIIQLANGGEGYLPTRKAEMGGHYSAFVSSGQVGHEGGELLVNATLDQINSIF